MYEYFVKINAVKETRVKVKEPYDVAKFLRKLIGDKDREYFAVLCLDTGLKINGYEIVSIGTLNSALVHPREVFKTAIKTNASEIILGHNHPSGDTNPSKEDIEITKRLKEAGNILGIPIIDHVIVGDGYFSFKDKEMIWILIKQK